jgi:histone H3/H4
VEPAQSASNAKTTGFLRHCTTCRLPYPKEMVGCPNCGASDGGEHVEEETLSGQFGATAQAAWSVQLLIEVLEKAMSTGRTADAERILRRATAQVEERILSGERVDAKQLEALSMAAAKLSLNLGDATWGSWVAQIHRRTSTVPAGPVIDSLAGLVERFPEEIGAALGDLATHCRGAITLTEEDARSLARIEQLRAGVASLRSQLS